MSKYTLQGQRQAYHFLRCSLRIYPWVVQLFWNKTSQRDACPAGHLRCTTESPTSDPFFLNTFSDQQLGIMEIGSFSWWRNANFHKILLYMKIWNLSLTFPLGAWARNGAPAAMWQPLKYVKTITMLPLSLLQSNYFQMLSFLLILVTSSG